MGVSARRCASLHRRGSALVPMAIVAALAMAMAPTPAAASGLMAWGGNANGELGNGTDTRSTVPVAVSGLASGVRAISAGSAHSLARLGDTTVKAWGANEYGQLGIGTSKGPSTCRFFEPCSTTPLAVSGLSGVSAFAAGAGHSLALLSDGTVRAWGLNEYGELGDGTHTGPSTCGRSPFIQPCSTTPVAVSELSGVVAVSAARASLALLSDGTVMAWGNNEYGQLGDGTTTDRDVPVAVSGLSGVVAISAGNDHSLALLSDGTVKAWGLNNDGQLGNGTTTNSSVPVEVKELSTVAAIAGGGFHSLALLSDGTVMAWGSNGNGQLGTSSGLETCGVFTCHRTPGAVSGLTEVTAIAAGLAHSLALLSDGTVMAWGWDNEGQLGNGAISEAEPVPGPVAGLTGVTEISAGGYYSMAYVPPPPTVTGVSPAEGPQAGGTSVTVTGTELIGATAVKFGSSDATSFTVNSESSITAVSPAGTGTVDVTVTTPAGTSATSAADQYTYVHVLSEDLPELGRCIKVAGTGAYQYKNCVLQSPGHTGNYEWVAGPGAKPAFTAEAGEVVLETVGGTRVTCAPGQLSGEWTGAKTASVNVAFKGCKNVASGKSCQSSPSAAAEITTAQALVGELGFISGKGTERPKVGLDLKPKGPSPNVLSFTCGGPPEELGTGEPWTVEGSVIGAIKPIDRMKTTYKLLYSERAGKQAPEHFEGALKDTLLASRIVGLETKAEQAGLTLRGERRTITAKAGEPLEIKAKV
jgi:hypothetical protein